MYAMSASIPSADDSGEQGISDFQRRQVLQLVVAHSPCPIAQLSCTEMRLGFVELILFTPINMLATY